VKGLIFTYLLTGGGAVASLFNPFAGLMVYVCFSIIRPEWMWYWSVPEGNYSRIVALCLLAGWAIQGFGRWQLGRAQRVVGALVAYLLWVLFVTLAIAPDKEVGLKFAEDQTKIVLPFLVGITTVRSIKQLQMLAWVIVLSQGYAALEFNLWYFSGFNRLWIQGFAGMDNNSVAIALVACCGMAIFLILESKTLWQRALAAVCCLLMIHAVLFSFSRGGLLALVTSGLVAFWLIPKKPIYYVYFAAVVLICWRLTGDSVYERFGTAFAGEEDRDGSAVERLALWKTCLGIMVRHPLGIGPDHFPLVSHEYGFPYNKMAHSLWLQAGAELGIVGLSCLVLFYGGVFVRLWPLARDKIPGAKSENTLLARMVVTSLIGFALAAQFVSLLRLEVPFYVALIGAGVLKLAPEVNVAANLGESDAYLYRKLA